MLVKPAKGLAVRDPELNDVLPAEGRDVPRNEYWLRRILDGDVTERAEGVSDAPSTPEGVAAFRKVAGANSAALAGPDVKDPR